MTDIEKNKLFVEQQTSTENPQETPAAMVKANDEEAQDKNEMPVENDKFEFFADIVSVVLKFFMGIMFICGARFLHKYADSDAETSDDQYYKIRENTDDRAAGFFILGMIFFFIATIVDLVKDSKLGPKHLIAHIFAICGIFFWWVGSLLFFPEVTVRHHYNVDSVIWIVGSLLLIIAQVTLFIAYSARDPRPNSVKFISVGFALLGSVLILAGAILMLGRDYIDSKDMPSFLEGLSRRCPSGNNECLNKVISEFMKNKEDRIRGSECYIAGAVFYLVYGILEIIAMVVGK